MNTKHNRARLLDMIRGGGEEIIIESCKIVFPEAKREAAASADYDGPIRVPVEEYYKYLEAQESYYKARGITPPEGESYDIGFAHATHLEAVEDARREYAAAPALVRHEDNRFYMHGEGKPGRPTIIGVLITEILQ